jgi:hypothetical protein
MEHVRFLLIVWDCFPAPRAVEKTKNTLGFVLPHPAQRPRGFDCEQKKCQS